MAKYNVKPTTIDEALESWVWTMTEVFLTKGLLL
jgi:hypothetical protein